MEEWRPSALIGNHSLESIINTAAFAIGRFLCEPPKQREAARGASFTRRKIKTRDDESIRCHRFLGELESVHQGIERLAVAPTGSARHDCRVWLVFHIFTICLLHSPDGHRGSLERISWGLGARGGHGSSLPDWICWISDRGTLEPLTSLSPDGWRIRATRPPKRPLRLSKLLGGRNPVESQRDQFRFAAGSFVALVS